MSCCNHKNINGDNSSNGEFININTDTITGQTANFTTINSTNINNSNLITTSGITGATAHFTNLFADNFSVGVTGISQLTVTQVSTSYNTNALMVSPVGSTLDTGHGLHIGFDSLAERGVIYALNGSTVAQPVHLAIMDSSESYTLTPELRTNTILERTALNGVDIQNVLNIKQTAIGEATNSFELRSGGSGQAILIENANGLGATFHNQGGVEMGSTLTVHGPILTNEINSIGATLNINNGFTVNNLGEVTNLTVNDPNGSSIINGTQNALFIQNSLNDSSNWISLSVGATASTNRVVFGNINGAATLGGHSWNGSIYTAWADLTINISNNVLIGNAPSVQKLSVNGSANLVNDSSYRINNLISLDQANLKLYNGANVGTFDVSAINGNRNYSMPNFGDTLAVRQDLSFHISGGATQWGPFSSHPTFTVWYYFPYRPSSSGANFDNFNMVVNFPASSEIYFQLYDETAGSTIMTSAGVTGTGSPILISKLTNDNPMPTSSTIMAIRAAYGSGSDQFTFYDLQVFKDP